MKRFDLDQSRRIIVCVFHRMHLLTTWSLVEQAAPKEYRLQTLMLFILGTKELLASGTPYNGCMQYVLLVQLIIIVGNSCIFSQSHRNTTI